MPAVPHSGASFSHTQGHLVQFPQAIETSMTLALTAELFRVLKADHPHMATGSIDDKVKSVHIPMD
jgi:hypothetical protein